MLEEDRDLDLPKFTKYDWRKLNDSNFGGYAGGIKFLTTSLMSELIDIKNAYIIINGTISSSTAVAYIADSDVTIKNGSYSILYETIIKANNTEIDHPYNLWLVMQIHNLLEFSQDYVISVAELWMYAKDTSITADDAQYAIAAGNVTGNNANYNSGFANTKLYSGVRCRFISNINKYTFYVLIIIF